MVLGECSVDVAWLVKQVVHKSLDLLKWLTGWQLG